MPEPLTDPISSVRSPWMLWVGWFLVLSLPGFHSLDLSPVPLGTALLLAGVLLLFQWQARELFRPPRWTRWILLPAFLLAPPFSLICLPYPVSVLAPLFALAWVLNTLLPGRSGMAPRFVLLFAVAWKWISLQNSLPDFPFPRLPSATPIWIGIALIVPLGVATQKRLRGFARGILFAEGAIAFFAVCLIPLVLQTVTGFKEVGEPERDFYRLSPLPGFQRIPDFGTESLIPSELRNFEDPLLAIQLLDGMNLSLQRNRLLPPDDSFEDDLSIRLLLQYGFLQQDRHGFFVPAYAYASPEQPAGVDVSFMTLVEGLAQQTRIASTEQTRPTLLRLRNRNLVDTVEGDSSRFRLTPQARQRMSNGLYPRQILFASEPPVASGAYRIRHAAYAPDWNLSFDQIRLELIELVDTGVLAIDDSLSWHTEAFSKLLLETRRIPRTVLIVLAGGLLVWMQAKPFLKDTVSLICFALGWFVTQEISSLPEAESPLVYQAVWATLWLPVSAVFFGIALKGSS